MRASFLPAGIQRRENPNGSDYLPGAICRARCNRCYTLGQVVSMTYQYYVHWVCDGCKYWHDMQRPVDSIGPFPANWLKVIYGSHEFHFHDRTCLLLHWDVVVPEEERNAVVDTGPRLGDTDGDKPDRFGVGSE